MSETTRIYVVEDQAPLLANLLKASGVKFNLTAITLQFLRSFLQGHTRGFTILKQSLQRVIDFA